MTFKLIILLQSIDSKPSLNKDHEREHKREHKEKKNSKSSIHEVKEKDVRLGTSLCPITGQSNKVKPGNHNWEAFLKAVSNKLPGYLNTMENKDTCKTSKTDKVINSFVTNLANYSNLAFVQTDKPTHVFWRSRYLYSKSYRAPWKGAILVTHTILKSEKKTVFKKLSEFQDICSVSESNYLQSIFFHQVSRYQDYYQKFTKKNKAG